MYEMNEPPSEDGVEEGSGMVPVQQPQQVHDALVEFQGPKGLEAANEIAVALDGLIRARGLAVPMGQGEHVKIEGWCALASLVGVAPRTEWTKEVRNPATGEFEGYTACVQVVRVGTGAVVGRAENCCMADEVQQRRDGSIHERWLDANGKPARHAIMSMAQTRAASKSLAQVLRFIPVMAGYSGTPLEEMPANDTAPPVQPDSGKAQRPANGGSRERSGGQYATITEAMAGHLLKRCRERGDKLGLHGFDVLAHVLVEAGLDAQPDRATRDVVRAHVLRVVTPDRFEALCSAADAWEKF